MLDNADGQLARAAGASRSSGAISTPSPTCSSNAALFAALAHVTGKPWLALVSFLVLTFVLSVDFNLERLYRIERGETREARPGATGAAAALARVYDAVYAPQDRLVERLVDARLRRLGPGPPRGLPTTTARP